MIEQLIRDGLNEVELALINEVPAEITVTRNFQDASSYTDAQLEDGVINIISTGVERTKIGLEFEDTHKLVILCWVKAENGAGVEDKELRLLGYIETVVDKLKCLNLLGIVQSGQKEYPLGHLGIDLEWEL